MSDGTRYFSWSFWFLLVLCIFSVRTCAALSNRFDAKQPLSTLALLRKCACCDEQSSTSRQRQLWTLKQCSEVRGAILSRPRLSIQVMMTKHQCWKVVLNIKCELAFR